MALERTIGATCLALGVAMVAVPRRVLSLAGLTPTTVTRWVVRGRGASEIAQGLGILARRQPTNLLRSRVVGDAGDLVLLLIAAPRAHDRRRLAAAMVGVVGIGVADLAATRRSAAAADRPATEGGGGSVAAITVNRPLEAVAPHVEGLRQLGDLDLRPAPGDRGTEIRIRVTGADSLREDLTGRGRSREATLIELRRVKQELEVGEVVRSEAAPEGPTVTRQLIQRTAQPVG